MGRQKSGHGWLEVDADLPWHPKVFSSARLLEIPKPVFLGWILGLWGGVAKHAEDGDLWRGSDEESVRFIASVCDIDIDPARFIEVLRMDRWLDGWIVHDWLDYRARYLISKWSSHYRDRLVATWAKHGRVYGKAGNEDSEPDNGQLCLFSEQAASGWEVIGNNSDPPTTHNPLTLTLNPNTLKETKKENPRGRSNEIATSEANRTATFGSSIIYDKGSRVQGYAVPVSQAELTGAGLTHKEVFEAFMSLFVTHAILSLESFYERTKRCRSTAAAWTMLFLDKIHAVYRDRNGTTLLADEDADPVAMTMAGMVQTASRHRHYPTEAARQLFIEVMMDYQRAKEKGGPPKWFGRLSGPEVAVELTRRKGRAGKIA